jgi:hypothetical protein
MGLGDGKTDERKAVGTRPGRGGGRPLRIGGFDDMMGLSFESQYPLDTQDPFSYTPAAKKQRLINGISSSLTKENSL